jgi:hypothetical protein
MYEREAQRHVAQQALVATIAEVKVGYAVRPRGLGAGLFVGTVRTLLRCPTGSAAGGCPGLRCFVSPCLFAFIAQDLTATASSTGLPGGLPLSRPGSGLPRPSSTDAEVVDRMRGSAARAQSQLDSLAAAMNKVQEATVQMILASGAGVAPAGGSLPA